MDVLITEGTMLGERAKEERFSERDLQKWATDYFKEHKYIFLKIMFYQYSKRFLVELF